jgi:2',3'-cyclic-nucleotide 2'-phosphodiesterase (5'-nucleotidase family)
MKRFVCLFLCLVSFVVSQETDTLYILQTTDMHGHIYPYNYFTDQPDNKSGLAKIYTRVVEYRQKHKNVILLDSGDLMQGTPLAYYFNHNERDLMHPLILTMNYMGYDGFAVGNHDIEQGLFVYNQAKRNADFPWLSANSILEDGRTFFKEGTIIKRGNIKIGIYGLTTPGIPMWLDKTLYPGIDWQDMVSTAKNNINSIRPKVDVMLGIFHAGFNAAYSKAASDAAGIPNENASAWVAEQVPGFDAIFAGHSHRAGPMKIGPQNQLNFNDGPALINAGFWGKNLAVVKIILKKDNDKWHIAEKSGWLESMKDVEASQAILDLTAYYHKKTLKYIRTQIGTLTAPMGANESKFKDTPLVELINKAQMAHTGAEISFAASFNDRFTMEAGPIAIKDIYGMYRFENFVYMVEMTGQQIKDFLEYSARYFKLENGRVFGRKDIPGFNYDMAEGVNYKVDVRQAIGKRIVDMKDPATEKEFDLERTYKVALNSYRASGGGGHMDAAGAKGNPVLFKSSKEMRNILIDYIAAQKTITPSVDNNWKIIKN